MPQAADTNSTTAVYAPSDAVYAAIVISDANDLIMPVGAHLHVNPKQQVKEDDDVLIHLVSGETKIGRYKRNIAKHLIITQYKRNDEGYQMRDLEIPIDQVSACDSIFGIVYHPRPDLAAASASFHKEIGR